MWINGYLGVWKGGDKGDFERFKGIFEGKEGEGFWENYNHGKQVRISWNYIYRFVVVLTPPRRVTFRRIRSLLNQIENLSTLLK